MNGGRKYLFCTLLKPFVACDLKLAHAALQVSLVLSFDRGNELLFRLFGRKVGDFLEFLLLCACQLGSLFFRSLQLLVPLHEVLGFRIKHALPLVEKLLLAHEPLLRLLQLCSAPLKLRRYLLFFIFCALLGFFDYLFCMHFRIQGHLADLQLHRAALAQRDNEAEEIPEGHAREPRAREEEKDYLY